MIPEVVIYLLKANFVLMLFYGGYQLFLKHHTFYSLNRIYLLIGLIYSSLYPLIDLTNLLQNNSIIQDQLSSMRPDWQSSITSILNQNPNPKSIYWVTGLYIFWIGVLIMAIRLIIQLISLLILHRNSEPKQSGEYHYRLIRKKVNPFSFWRTIYLNSEYHQSKELESILKHEQVHVRQLHSLDVLIAEISIIFFWFNPGVWLMKKTIQANLEFITDQQVLNSGVDSKEYQYTLLKINLLPQNALPVNNFHLLTIKKRITMMNKKPSNRIKKVIYLLVLPAIILTSLLITSSKAAFNNSSLNTVINHLPEIPEIITFNGDLMNKAINSEKNQADTNKTKDKVVLVIRDNDTAGDRANQKKPIYIVDGLEVKTISQINPNLIESINVLKGEASIERYGAAGAEGAIEITTKSESNKKTLPTENEKNSPVKGLNAKISLSDLNNQELILLDGKEVDRSVLNELPVNSIEKIEVFKGEEAVKMFSEKGRKGVIIISTKKN